MRALDAAGPEGHTTNLVAIDSDGNACVLTTSLGLGSGDFLPGLDLHLNSMLGEADLIREALEPGDRMGSMMAPSLAFDAEGLALAAGAAGGTRLRSALVQVAAGILDEGLDPQEAVSQPRLHPAAGLVHLEPGFPTRCPPRSRPPGSRFAPGRRGITTSEASASSRGPAPRGIPGGAERRRRCLPAERQPAEVAALGTPGVRLGRPTADGLRVGAPALEAAHGFEHLQAPLRCLRLPAHV